MSRDSATRRFVCNGGVSVRKSASSFASFVGLTCVHLISRPMGRIDVRHCAFWPEA